MRNGSSRRLVEYWNEIRGRNTAPDKSRFNPLKVPGIVDRIVLFELKDGRSPIRICGSGICRLFGRDLGLQEFIHLWHASSQGGIEEDLKNIAGTHAALAITAKGINGFGETVAIEMALVPLIGDGTMSVAAVIEPLEEVEWLAHRPIRDCTFVSRRLIPVSMPLPKRPERPKLAIVPKAELPLGIRVRHLVVIEGGLA